MESKDLVSRVKHARGYFPVVGVGAFDGFFFPTFRRSSVPAFLRFGPEKGAQRGGGPNLEKEGSPKGGGGPKGGRPKGGARR